MIYLDNGISVYSGRGYRLDPKRCVRDCINLISHAHFDHVPSSFNSPAIICSDITRSLIEARTGSSIPCGPCSCETVTLHDSGHVPGSSMFLINGDKRILYTGDFNTRKKYFSDGAKPVKADVLIMESTFGREKYVFPPTEEVFGEIKDWIDDNAARGLNSIIYAYSFGKAQEVISALSGYTVYASRSVIEINRTLGKFDLDISAMPLPEDLKGPDVVVAPSGSRNSPEIKKIFKAGAKSASVSGWALDDGHKYAMRVDRAFPLSDHADYSELIGFVEKVSPDLVFTLHGFDKEFARDIRDKLDIEAAPLKKRHLSLSNFTGDV
ncbi:hypothetical protein CUJ83_01930 [Methanocella sp. CWC-04]|uniref:Zn-dependent metallo-hydrolase RNA specificity domain-containing protein n=1 Tax=Methanooceanicella nereidis TaxID=2052831 RepID=A0AAP2RAU1_9EURY|nr:MBL fold metallo-hydrolase RNA specificity domain-containing protein [Methanocella sp. CWC-04]MCD1293754.1 hypothetical protein [Methanocella sp. CWC-04]